MNPKPVAILLSPGPRTLRPIANFWASDFLINLIREEINYLMESFDANFFVCPVSHGSAENYIKPLLLRLQNSEVAGHGQNPDTCRQLSDGNAPFLLPLLSLLPLLPLLLLSLLSLLLLLFCLLLQRLETWNLQNVILSWTLIARVKRERETEQVHLKFKSPRRLNIWPSVLKSIAFCHELS